MKLQSRYKWQIIKQYSVGWTFAFIFLAIVRGEGTQELGSVQLDMWRAILTSFVMGPLFGSISGYAQILTEEHGYRQVSFQKLLGLRFVYALLFVTSIVLLAFLVYGENISLLEFAFEPGSFAIYLYIITADLFLFGLRQVNLYFGGSNLSKLLRGRFYTPHEEKRIFMFLDLKSSTAHAERLGHIRYSKMIRDCFNDIGVVIENAAEIYQYVGDEVILTWEIKDGLKNENCLRAFYNFKEELQNRSAYYRENYDCLPEFKAGIHCGLVTVTEVGKYKKEIAYHGDTINTAARIQGKCNEFDEEFLISEDLKHLLEDSDYEYKELGSLTLRGKTAQVAIFAINDSAS